MDIDNTRSSIAESVARRPWLLGLCTGLVLFAFVTPGVILIHRSADRALEASLKDSLRCISLAAAQTIDPTLHAQIGETVDKQSPAYQRTAASIEGLARSLPNIRAMYTFRGQADGTPQILVNPNDGANLQNLHAGAAHTSLGMRDARTDPVLLEAIRSGVTTVSPMIHTDDRGSFVSGYSPVRNAGDEIVCFVGVDVDADALLHLESSVHLVATLGLAFALVGSTALGYSVYAWQGRRERAEQAAHLERVQLLRTESLTKAANQAKDDFIANVSHEIRTPLAAIIGYAELLREQRFATGNALVDGAADAIARNGAHLLGVVNDILDVSQVEAGALAIHVTPMDLCVTAHEATELLAVRAAAKRITLTVESAPGQTVPVNADPLRVRQILLNLIGNAIKFTESGGVKVIISQTGPWAVVEVHDSGPGMSPEQLNRLFQRFSRVDRDTTSLGTGIGLELSQRLARLMQGGISAESTPGVGAIFRLSLMSAPVQAHHNDAVNTPSDVTATPVHDFGPLPLAGIDVLMAEDGIDNARLWRHHLEQAGAEVWHASNGREAIGLVRAAALGVLERPFDIVLMDMEMPVMDGVEATKQLRAEGYRLPIVGLTAHSDGTTRTNLLAAGCNDCATKPISRIELARVILAHVRPVSTQKSVQSTASTVS